MPTRTRAVAYVRVAAGGSDAGQAGLDAQQAEIAAYAARHGLTIVRVFSDAGASALSLERNGLAGALGDLRMNRADLLVVASLDRLTRSPRDFAILADSHFAGGRWALRSVREDFDTDTDGGRRVLEWLTKIAHGGRESP